MTMEVPPSSSSSSKGQKMGKTGISMMNEDLLQNIVAKLPALSFASAACVSKTWNQISKRVLSRPKLASAFSLTPNSNVAIQEVLDKVLAEPIRPDFAIAIVGTGFNMKTTLQRIRNKLGSTTPIVVSRGTGIIGRDALTDQFREVNWGDDYSVDDFDKSPGISLTVGFVPGLKVDAIPLIQQKKAPLEPLVDNFVMDIRNYTMSVSGTTSPVGIIMFGYKGVDQKPILEKLDYAMPKETFIVGDERSQPLCKSAINLRNSCGSFNSLKAVALIFARDRNKPYGMGEIQFHVALSNGVSAIGPRYKAVSVNVIDSECSTWLTARREGQQEILDGQQILNDIDDELDNRIECPDLYIGVTKRRKCSIGAEKARSITSLAFHGVDGGDEEYLYANGGGIKTGDHFQFYHSDPNTALTSSSNVSVYLRNLKLDWNSKNCHNLRGVDIVDKKEAFGGFIFACCSRGKSFFGSRNVDSSPFLENFPGVPLSGIFCNGEIGRSVSSLTGQGGLEESSSRVCLHVYSTIYLVMSYTPAPPEH